ncbi:MAG: hypothetical protein ACE5J7_02020 [Candidatus Aenigmatarchaeota archaeon]
MAKRRRAARKPARLMIEEHRAGLSLGAIFAIWHAGWVLFVAAGIGDAFIAWISGVHMLTNPYTVLAFDATAAVIGLIGAFICGYITGWIFAAIWNRV